MPKVESISSSPLDYKFGDDSRIYEVNFVHLCRKTVPNQQYVPSGHCIVPVQFTTPINSEPLIDFSLG